MTLCIAAICQDRGKSRIVIGTDWRAEGAVAGADIQDKLYWVGEDIAVLIAGTITRAVELKNTIIQHFEQRQLKKLPSPKAADLFDFFRVPVVRFKRKLVGEYIGLQFGLTYREFLQAVGLKQIPDGIAVEAFGEIKKLNQDCSLLLCTFDTSKEPRILQVEERGELEVVESFAAIGSGNPVAESILFQRGHTPDATLGATIYHVYEAMKIGAIAPGVGEDFTVNVLYPPDRSHANVYGYFVNPRGTAFFEQQFKEKGPKKFKNFPKLPKNIFDPDF